MNEIMNSKDYINFLNNIKEDIQISRIRAALSINKELILLYWRIGKGILDRQEQFGWELKVIEQLSLDLKHSFPEVQGFSPGNLKYMRILAFHVSQEEISPQAVDQIPWGHLCVLMDTFDKKEIIFWYIRKTIINGWSQNVLLINIEAKAHLVDGTADDGPAHDRIDQANFLEDFSSPNSDLVQQVIKSKHHFDFLGVREETNKTIIESRLIHHIRDFLLEMGGNFAFMGIQYRLEFAGEEFFIDLLMYQVRLKCYVVIELKTGKFKLEYLNKLNFYTISIDHEFKDAVDNPTIGLLLCQTANYITVDYCLKDPKNPAGRPACTTSLPIEYNGFLPTPEQFQHLIDTLQNQTKEDI